MDPSMQQAYGGANPLPPGKHQIGWPTPQPPHHELASSAPPTIPVPSGSFHFGGHPNRFHQPQDAANPNHYHSSVSAHTHHITNYSHAPPYSNENPPSYPGANVPAPMVMNDPQTQYEIDRGLNIDFYSVSDRLVLASWASFFRDMYNKANEDLMKASYDRPAETYRRVTHFLERVETRVVKSEAMEKIFRDNPRPTYETPVFVDICYRTIIDYLMRYPPFDGSAFGSPQWRDYLWYKCGLKEIIERNRTAYLVQYARDIVQSIDSFINERVEMGSNRDEIRTDLFEASRTGRQTEIKYTHAKMFYKWLFLHTARGHTEQGTAGGDYTAPSRTGDSSMGAANLDGKPIREHFSLEEEAFILSVIRTYLGRTPGASPGERGFQSNKNNGFWDDDVVYEIGALLSSQELSREKFVPDVYGSGRRRKKESENPASAAESPKINLAERSPEQMMEDMSHDDEPKKTVKERLT